MDITFPVLVLEKDSGDILRFESASEMQRYLERIDVENNEYAAWDPNGHPLSLIVQEPAWLKIVPASEVGASDLNGALKRFAQHRQVSLTDNDQSLAHLALYEAIVAKGGEGRKPRGASRSQR